MRQIGWTVELEGTRGVRGTLLWIPQQTWESAHNELPTKGGDLVIDSMKTAGEVVSS